MIEVNNLNKIYGKKDTAFNALKDITLNIEDKSTVSIIGKSGSGKSTLMHIMSGLDEPSSGTVLIDGVDIFKMKEKKIDAFRASEMSFVFQSFFVELFFEAIQLYSFIYPLLFVYLFVIIGSFLIIYPLFFELFSYPYLFISCSLFLLSCANSVLCAV